MSTTRWWNRKKNWILLFITLFLVFVRISKGTLYRDIYYFISQPFWPGMFQKEIIQNSITKATSMQLEQLENDNKRLRRVLSLQSVSDPNKISASVISRKTDSWWQLILLNKGVNEGIEKGNAVIGPGGLLGLVENTSMFTSTVKLLTSTESKVGVWAKSINEHGLLIGDGSPSPKIIFYKKDLDLKIGDLIFSSPASTLLPPNLPIGIVVSIDKESKPNISANVQLIARPQAIDWVQVLKMNVE